MLNNWKSSKNIPIVDKDNSICIINSLPRRESKAQKSRNNEIQGKVTSKPKLSPINPFKYLGQGISRKIYPNLKVL